MAGNLGTWGETVAGFVLVEHLVRDSHQSCESHRGKIVGPTKVEGVNFRVGGARSRIGESAGVQAGARIRDTRGHQGERVGHILGDVVFISGAIVVNEAHIRSELHSVLAAGPGDVVDEVRK